MGENIDFYDKVAVMWTDGRMPHETSDLIESTFFRKIVSRYIEFLKKHNSHLLKVFNPESDNEEGVFLSLLSKLNQREAEEIKELYPELTHILYSKEQIIELIEEFYNYWRNHERYLVCTSSNLTDYDKRPYRTFNYTVSHMNHLIRKVYRDIVENITGEHPRIYRQVAAGFQVGIIAKNTSLDLPDDYSNLKNIFTIRQALLYPPIIIDPTMNKRKGSFVKVDKNPIKEIKFSEREWLCYPAKVGDLLINIYFHNKFIGLGSSLSNLFDLADEDDLKKKPDAVYAFGVDSESMKDYEEKTVFFEDKDNDIFCAAVPRDDCYGYFGYLKKMVLTLHNNIMMKRGRLPIHGAMVNIKLKEGSSANVVILGDSGAGKSESLEAFRILGEEYIEEMKIIFDDMGSFDIKDSKVLAYGTETGAFVRLDDLQPGFAFGNLDRSIIMSPQKVNARAVIPVTTIKEVNHGYPVDFFLYANNYEEIDDDHPIVEVFKDKDEALSVFREGAVMSKGTTNTKGLVHTYFANIFGPPAYKELHDKLAEKYFDKLFESGVFVGQLRTRLGIEGFFESGPRDAAKALFEEIKKR